MYRRIFGFIDANGDGQLSKKEFIDDGRYLTRQARQGIFRASDSNGDGNVSEDEYIENRIITDIITDNTDPTVRTAYKMLRTRLLQRMRANGWQSLAVTSASPGDGKTLTAINLAISLAGDVNHNICLVDLDLRHSSVARYLGMELDKGTSDCLRRKLSLEEALVRPNIERLVVLPNTQIEAQ